MKIEASILVEAPPRVVFRFFCFLDHLRFISARRRREWSPGSEEVVSLNSEYEVRVEQGRHSLKIRFRTVRFEEGRLREDEFISWPLKGARHLMTFEPIDGGTRVIDANIWYPQWYLRHVAQKHEEDQTTLFEEKLANAKKAIEAVYRLRGDAAFEQGILLDLEAAGVQPVVPLDYGAG